MAAAGAAARFAATPGGELVAPEDQADQPSPGMLAAEVDGGATWGEDGDGKRGGRTVGSSGGKGAWAAVAAAATLRRAGAPPRAGSGSRCSRRSVALSTPPLPPPPLLLSMNSDMIVATEASPAR